MLKKSSKRPVMKKPKIVSNKRYNFGEPNVIDIIERKTKKGTIIKIPTIVEVLFKSLLAPTKAIFLYFDKISFVLSINFFYLFFQIGFLFSINADIPSFASIDIILIVIILLV